MRKKVDERTERLIRDSRMRGGRAGQVMKDKRKYDRKRDKQLTKKEIDKWRTEQDNQ